MRLRTHSLLIAAAIAACAPVTAKAAVITYFYDSNIEVSTDGGQTFSPAPISGTPQNMSVQINPGDYLAVAVDGSITGNPNAAASGAYAAAHPGSVPANLGIAEFQVGMSDSNQSVAMVESAGFYNGTSPVGNSFTTAQINSNFTAGANGLLDGFGGVAGSDGTIGEDNAQGTSAAVSARLTYGTQTGGAQLYNNLILGGYNGPVSTTGTTTFSLLASSPNQAYFYGTAASGNNSAPAYAVTPVSRADSIVVGSLTVSVVPAPPGPVITLYGTDRITKTAPSATLSLSTGESVGDSDSTGSVRITPYTATGFATITGFQPSGTELYALKLRDVSGTISPSDTALISEIVADINGQNGNPASHGVTASLISGAYSSQFPGYDVLLTSDSGFTTDGTSQLNFDFSSLGTEDPAEDGLAVTGIAAAGGSVSAVPEPTTLFGVLAGGVLLSRRTRRDLKPQRQWPARVQHPV